MGDKELSGFDDFESTPMGEFEVIISRGYWLGVYPVTQCQWQAVMGTNPSVFKGNNHPVTNVGWQDAMDFCDRLAINQPTIPDGYAFSLPTQAQWEYVCRAGTTYKYQLGDSLEDLSRVAWHSGNVDTYSTQAVGQKEPNHWGMYDMLGNALEWCFDGPLEYPDGTVQTDWVGGFKEGIRIARGASIFLQPPEALTCGTRMDLPTEPYLVSGFRLCLRQSINPDLKTLNPPGQY